MLRWRLSRAASYRLRDISQGKYSVHCRPTSIILMLTELCNARCTHCDIWKNKGKEDAPTLDQWKQVVTDMRHWLGPAQVTLSGGEALLRKDAQEVLRHGSEVGLLTELHSHGYWPDGKRMEQVARANPWQVTFSVDGVGEVHNVIRGKADFWDRTSASLDTLIRLRREEGPRYQIQLKNVLMRQNLDSAVDVARFAAEKGIRVFYQLIEQNHNTEEDEFWYRTSPNWPDDPDKDGLRLTIQAHTAHEARASCSGKTGLQIQANGDVASCFREPRFGNIKQTRIRELRSERPRYWETGCCKEKAKTPGANEIVSIKGVGV
jgi:MoaA/NifB/PqqE/SkfB family radical SAM enzyme